MKLAFFATLIAVSALAQQPINLADLQANKTPDLVLKLLQWPTAELVSTSSIPTASTNVAAAIAIAQAERWVRMVVDPQWLPESLVPLCISREFENRDVVRYKWMSGGCSFMVAQTWSIFTLEIRPEAGSLGGESKVQRLDGVRKVCMQVFRKTGQRLNFQDGDDFEVSDFNAKLIEFSFSAETTREITNEAPVLAGRAKTMEEEGVKPPEAAADAEAESGKWRKPGWEKSSLAWEFWFRNVNWFAGHDRIVVFFVKAEAGPLIAGPDNGWFRGAK